MTSSIEREQRLLRGLLRGTLRLLFSGLIRPPMPIAGQRLLLRALSVATRLPQGIHRSHATLGGVPCEWQRPAGESGRVLLYLHGGAYLIGSPATYRAITAGLAKHCDAAVCVPDYRLAPEHPYPAALEDALAVYAALLDHGIAARDIVLVGDSAGGNLLLSAALALPARGLPVPAALVTFSPWTDMSLTHLHQPPAGDPLLTRAWINQAVELFCPAGLAPASAQVSPVNADLTGLPRLLIQVGEDELLLNDSLRLAERARAAGVAVTLQRYPGCWHVFQSHAGVLDVADRALQEVARFIDQPGDTPCPLS